MITDPGQMDAALLVQELRDTTLLADRARRHDAATAAKHDRRVDALSAELVRRAAW